MTDKQIIIYKKECYNEPYCSLNQVLEQLKAKEQECEELDNEAQNLFTEKTNLELEVKDLRQQLDLLKFDYAELEKRHNDSFEQFNQLKAENEELKHLANHNGRVCNERLDKIDELEHDINELNGQLDQLKAENDELKRQRQADKGLITSTGKMNYQLLQEYDKLKNCLTEIKEIAEHSVILDCNECPMENWCEELCSNENNFQEVILQKISEVENG